MSKELFISSSPHETKAAVLEDDQLVEVYFERDTDAGVVGGIYKGRVSRVLPGMQSAFVNIGLERDAFLYVSDLFLEDSEEFDKLFEDAESRAMRASLGADACGPSVVSSPAPAGPSTTNLTEGAVAPQEVAASEEEIKGPSGTTTPPAQPATGIEPQALSTEASGLKDSGAETAPPAGPERRTEFQDNRRFEPRGRRRRRRSGRNFPERPFGEHKRFFPPAESHSFEVLPGESLAKYRNLTSETPPGEASEGAAGAAVAEAPGETEVEKEFSTVAEVSEGFFPEPTSPEDLTEDTLEVPESAEFGVTAALPEKPPEQIPAFHPAEAMPTPEMGSVEASNQAPPALVNEAPSAAECAPPELAFEVHPDDRSLDEETEEGTDQPLTGEQEVEAQSDAGDEPESGEPYSFEEVASEEPEELAPSPAGSGESSSAPAGETRERTYTLREPHERPRYAPRRIRRGRRGMGGRRSPRRENSRPGNNQPVQIAELLKEGQEILVQIAKEPLGTKGARITSHIALPGRYLVYMPTINHIGVSRKITSEEERLRLRNIILENRGSLTGGFIVRTAGAGRSEDEFKADLKFLMTLWNDIRTRAENSKAPALIHRDLDLVQRLLRDILTPDFKQVWVDNEVEYERVLDFVSRCQPSLVGHVKLYTRDTPLFEEFGIQAEIEKALKPKVWLKSGGYIVINQTEALVAIDVNTGKYVGKTNRLEDTILKTNIDAVNEIVRQVRLRDLGGIIVIDFIDMDERKNRAKVVQALEEALRKDRAPTKVISFHDFGLVAVTRKRVKQSLERTLCEPCSYCSGSGWIKSPTTVCYEILAEVRKMAKHIEGDSITVRVNPEVAKALKSREGKLVAEMESLTRRDVVIKSDPSVHQERFEIY
ncbi:MAG TPA: Rne/Rng family ribonuclease [Terriglobia bacterium]|nr:Rne/Rng family ribonuclease [Terriglobia bacterium]